MQRGSEDGRFGEVGAGEEVVRPSLCSRSAIVAAYIAYDVGRIWAVVWWTGLAPGHPARRSPWASCWTLLIAYGVALALAIGGLVVATRPVDPRPVAAARSRPYAARVVLLSVATLIGLGLLEAGVAGPSRTGTACPPAPPEAPAAAPPAERATGDLLLLVIGESSAEGQPFHPWFSIGHVIARRDRAGQPGRRRSG